MESPLLRGALMLLFSGITAAGCAAGSQTADSTASICDGVECSGKGTCVPGLDAAVCICEPGYGAKGTECIQQSEPCQDVTCSGQGVCAVVGEESVCLCNEGYYSQGTTCVAGDDPCEGVECSGHGVCIAALAGPTCVCAGGYHAKDLACEQDADPCASVDCGEHGICAVAEGAVICVCEQGYGLQSGVCVLSDGPCQGIDCSGHGICAVADGTPVCVCESGFHAEGTTCVQDESVCDEVTCSGHGRCVISQTEPLCLCEQGWYGVGADCLKAEEVCAGVDCGPHGACVSASNGPICVCDAGWVSSDTECIEEVDVCNGVDCSGLGACVPTSQGAVCVCAPGYHAQDLSCVADDNPCEGVDCSGQGVCVNASGQPACLCGYGYLPQGLACLPLPEESVADYSPVDPDDIVNHPQTGQPYVVNELVLAVDLSITEGQVALLTADVGAEMIGAMADAGLYQLRFPSETSFNEFSQARDLLASKPGVQAVSERWIEEPAAAPDDPEWDSWAQPPEGNNWYLEMIRAPEAWDHFTGSPSFPVGVIDVHFTNHPDLKANLASFEPLDKAWVFGEDEINHGTYVAGILAADGDNDMGVSGVLWHTSLHYCQTDLDTVRTLWCARRLINAGVRVINMSIGSTSPWKTEDPEAQKENITRFSGIWKSFLEHYLDQDWVIVQAAGNDAIDKKWSAYVSETGGAVAARVISVGAVTSEQELADYSNDGELDIVAPGGDTLCYLGECFCWWDSCIYNLVGTWYGQKTGTSMAAPQVAGALALAWSMYPNMTPEEAKALLIDSSPTTVQHAGFEYQMLDVEAAVVAAEDKCNGESYGINPNTGTCNKQPCAQDCNGKVCGPDGCGGLCGEPWPSKCDGNIASYCVNGKVKAVDCGAVDGVCDWDGEKGMEMCVIQPDVDVLPSGKVLSPTANEDVVGSFPVSVSASDDTAVSKLTVKVAGANGEVFTESISPGLASVDHTTQSVDTTDWAPGVYWIALWVADEVHPAVQADVVAISWNDGYAPCWPNCGEMVTIPAGTFWMGCNAALDTDCNNNNEFPYHEVFLSEYKIDRTEVTQGAYATCVASGVCSKPGGNWSPVELSDYPVAGLTWSSANDYCHWIGKRLPTEAEWEKAARGTDGRIFPWGNEPATCERAVMSSNGDGCGTGGTLPVCSRSPAGDSPYGLCDMAGNLWEWVSDWYGAEYYYDSPLSNPTGPPSGPTREFRGGWAGNASSGVMRASNRNSGNGWGSSDPERGFRCAK